jgi:hypothetical protein
VDIKTKAQVVRDLLEQAAQYSVQKEGESALLCNRQAMVTAMSAFMHSGGGELLHLALMAYRGIAVSALITGRIEEGSTALATGIANAELGLRRWPDATPLIEELNYLQSLEKKTGSSGSVFISEDGTTWPFAEQAFEAVKKNKVSTLHEYESTTPLVRGTKPNLYLVRGEKPNLSPEVLADIFGPAETNDQLPAHQGTIVSDEDRYRDFHSYWKSRLIVSAYQDLVSGLQIENKRLCEAKFLVVGSKKKLDYDGFNIGGIEVVHGFEYEQSAREFIEKCLYDSSESILKREPKGKPRWRIDTEQNDIPRLSVVETTQVNRIFLRCFCALDDSGYNQERFQLDLFEVRSNPPIEQELLGYYVDQDLWLCWLLKRGEDARHRAALDQARASGWLGRVNTPFCESAHRAKVSGDMDRLWSAFAHSSIQVIAPRTEDGRLYTVVPPEGGVAVLVAEEFTNRDIPADCTSQTMSGGTLIERLLPDIGVAFQAGPYSFILSPGMGLQLRAITFVAAIAVDHASLLPAYQWSKLSGDKVKSASCLGGPQKPNLDLSDIFGIDEDNGTVAGEVQPRDANLTGVIAVETNHTPMVSVHKDKLMRFQSHDLCIDVFSAGDAYVRYAADSDHLFLNKVSIAKPAGWDEVSPDVKSGPYPAFEGPLSVRWRSLDRTEHACELDLSELIPEPKILIQANMDDIDWTMPLLDPEPTLIIEIDDRKLSLYMHAIFRLRPDSLGAGRPRLSRQKTLVYSKVF